MPSRADRAPENPTPPGGLLPPTPTSRQCLATILHSGLVMAQLPRSKEMPNPRPPITPDPSVAFKVPPGPGPQANAGMFEQSDPSFHTRLHPDIHMPTHAASHLTSSPSALGWGAVWPVEALHTLHTAWLPRLSPRPAPATGIGVPAFLPL